MKKYAKPCASSPGQKDGRRKASACGRETVERQQNAVPCLVCHQKPEVASDGDIEEAAIKCIRQVAAEKAIKLIECEAMVDHVHLLLDVAPTELSETLRILKGGSAYKVFRRFPELKFDARTNNFWQKRYGAKQVAEGGRKTVAEYIRTQKDRPEKFER